MSTHESTEKKHSSFGDKIKGAAHVVHGMGEDFRGSVMGAFESVSGSEEAKAKEAGIAAKGKAEIERGVAQMKGVPPPASATAGPEPHAETDEKLKDQPAKEEVSGTTPAPPPSPVESRQPQPETSQQQPGGQTGDAEQVQQNTQSTQAGSEVTSFQTEGQDQTGEGAKTTQGPGSSV